VRALGGPAAEPRSAFGAEGGAGCSRRRRAGGQGQGSLYGPVRYVRLTTNSVPACVSNPADVSTGKLDEAGGC
jgi:hypothetical protein